eukprot:344537_1
MAKAKVTTVGDRVKLKKDELVGVVRFIGEIQGKKGVFFGIELDDAKGKNKGRINKISYFKCGKNKGLFVKQTGIAKTNAKNNADAPRITVGDKVKCKKQRTNGTIRFIGTPYSVQKSGILYGIELDKPKGNNNGTVKGRCYFKCKDRFGAFVTASGLTPLSGDKGNKTKDKKAHKKKKKKEKKAKENDDEKKEDIVYKVGDKVMIKPNRKGQIKWIGETKHFGEGV